MYQVELIKENRRREAEHHDRIVMHKDAEVLRRLTGTSRARGIGHLIKMSFKAGVEFTGFGATDSPTSSASGHNPNALHRHAFDEAAEPRPGNNRVFPEPATSTFSPEGHGKGGPAEVLTGSYRPSSDADTDDTKGRDVTGGKQKTSEGGKPESWYSYL